MVEKFKEFDEYQLAKHGKKVKKQDIPIFCSEEDEQEEDMEIEAQQQISLKSGSSFTTIGVYGQDSNFRSMR